MAVPCPCPLGALSHASKTMPSTNAFVKQITGCRCPWKQQHQRSHKFAANLLFSFHLDWTPVPSLISPSRTLDFCEAGSQRSSRPINAKACLPRICWKISILACVWLNEVWDLSQTLSKKFLLAVKCLSTWLFDLIFIKLSNLTLCWWHAASFKTSEFRSV